MTGAAFWSQLQQAAANTLSLSCCSLLFIFTLLLPHLPAAPSTCHSSPGQCDWAAWHSSLLSSRGWSCPGNDPAPPPALTATPVSHTTAKKQINQVPRVLFTLIPAPQEFIVHEELSSKTEGRRPACLSVDCASTGSRNIQVVFPSLPCLPGPSPAALDIQS